MRTSIHTPRHREHQRLASLVSRVALSATPADAVDLERLVTLVRAGTLTAHQAHQRILDHQAQQEAA